MMSSSFSTDPTKRFPYQPPSWAQDVLTNVPSAGRLHLAHLPTPLYKLSLHEKSTSPVKEEDSVLKQLDELDISLWIKRDDMCGGVETGGNKIRKLEFLLAEALSLGRQSVVTIGGEQSNHCRATAAAARMVGLEPHLILRTKRADPIQKQEENIGYTGNILFDRMVGSTIYTCTPGEYGRLGSRELVSRLCQHLKDNSEESSQSSGEPYAIPVGGSNGVGTWGYINGVDELMQQWKSIDSSPSLDHVVFACGSGGTATGIAVGLALAHGAGSATPTATTPTVHAVGVCDTPDYFYGFCAGIADEMGFKLPGDASTESFIRDHMIAHQGKGLGYAVSTQEELDFCTNFALETGVVLDPVYSGKALYHFIKGVLEEDPEKYRGKNVLLWHTGGSLGMYDKGPSLIPTLDGVAPAKRLDIYGKNLEHSIDISESVDS